MDILGVGFSELLFILVIAMMVFGPRRLPEIAAKAGKMVGNLRNMSQGLMAEWQREITVAARLEELQEAKQELEKTRQELTSAKNTVNQQTAFDAKSIAPEEYKPKPIRQMPVTPAPQKASPQPAPAPEPEPPAPPDAADPQPVPRSESTSSPAKPANGASPTADDAPDATAPMTNGSTSRLTSPPKESLNE